MISPGLLRLLLALVVVFHHCTPLRLGSWAVYVFFILSGYWVSAMWQNKYAKARTPYLTFLISRWWRLAPVLLLVSVCCVLLYRFGIGTPAGFVNSASWWGRQALVVGSSSAGKILPPAWSLDVEAQFYILAPLLVTLVGRVPMTVTLAGIAASMGLLGYHIANDGSGEAAALQLFVGFFLIGVLIQQRRWTPKRITWIAGLALFGIEVCALASNHLTRSAVLHAGRDVGAYVSAWVGCWSLLGALFCVPFVAANVRQKSSPFDRALGNLAYPLYLFHWLPRDWYYAHMGSTHGGLSLALLLLLNFAMAIAGAVAILLCFDGPIDRLRDKWVKSRMPNGSNKATVPVAELSNALERKG